MANSSFCPCIFQSLGGRRREVTGGQRERYRTNVRRSRGYTSPGYLPYMSRVVVIGGGVIGCAAAERLTLDGHEVTLLERDQLGAHASGAAAGELSPSQLDSDTQALAMFPEVVARIEKDSALTVEYRLQQGLTPAFTAQEAEQLKAGEGRWLDAREVRQAEPALSSDVLGALLLEHAHLTPRSEERRVGKG